MRGAFCCSRADGKLKTREMKLQKLFASAFHSQFDASRQTDGVEFGNVKLFTVACPTNLGLKLSMVTLLVWKTASERPQGCRPVARCLGEREKNSSTSLAEECSSLSQRN